MTYGLSFVLSELFLLKLSSLSIGISVCIFFETFINGLILLLNPLLLLLFLCQFNWLILFVFNCLL